MECTCHKPGYCPHFNRILTERHWEIAHGINVTPEQQQKYFKLWRQQAEFNIQPNEIEEPGLLQKAVNLTKAVTQHAAAGFKKLPPEHTQARLQICSTCELFNKEKQSCKKCGCNMGVKASWAEQKCPHPSGNKWESVDRRFTVSSDPNAPLARKLILQNHLSPGDVLVSTAAVESLHRQFPGQFQTSIQSSCPAIWENNPHIVPDGGATASGATDGKGEAIKLEYPLIHQSNQFPVHFMQGYIDFLAQKLEIPLKLTVNRPYLYFSREETEVWVGRIQEQLGKKRPYWIINAGTKRDFTAKQYPFYQQVVDSLQGKVLFVQVGESSHLHTTLKGVINQIGKTSSRELIRLCYHAQGGLGPSTFIQHIFAALEKPYVCLLGGREPVSWVQYPRQTTLHTMGTLPCCQSACWRSRTVKLKDGDKQDYSLCELPVFTEPPAPKCMAMISPEEVALATLRYV